AAAALTMMTSGLAGPTEADPYDTAVQAAASAEADIIAFRHDLHRFPELSGEEKRTSGKVAAALSELGYDVRTGVGGYGVVALLEGAGDGPLIAFRADMDAVAGQAFDPVPYASEIEGVHHICGHDMHTAIGIGIAEGFAAIRDEMPGSVMLIFQPAEEAGTGAESMLAEGLFVERRPDAIFALHTAPFDVGQLAVLPDGMMAGRTLISVSLTGDGNLDAAVSGLRDALEATGNVSLETMLAFRTEPFIFINLFPQAPAESGTAKVEGFVMSAGLDDRPRVEKVLREAVVSVDIENVQMSVTFRQALEGVNNDAALVDRASAAMNEQAPDITVFPVPGVIPAFSEDFGSFQMTVPGVMYFLGVNNPETGTVGFPHSPDYVADDGAIMVGTRAMLAAMLEVMGE
ncbi:MAG: amidohydrolase, partial [Pseudomonadota bacterium]